MGKRIISVVICLLLLTAAVPFSAVSAETIPETPKALAAEELPDAMIGKISEKTLVARVNDFENDPYSLVFANDDGTYSLFYFSEPVKYTASDGTVKDKSTALSEQNGAFRSGDNDFSAVLPYGAAEGVTVSYGEYAVTFKANGAADSRGVKTGRDCVIYENVFENVSLRYTMLLNGLKEDIILTSPECAESVSFTVYTNGLSLSEYEDGYYFASGDEKLFKLGELTVEDSSGVFDEKEYAHETTVEAVEDGEEYKVTLTVDRAYLDDPARVYPVYVDPTVTLNTTTQIEDTTIYSGANYQNNNYGTAINMRTGYRNSNFKQSYTLIKFPGLSGGTSLFTICYVSEITSANLYLYSRDALSNSTWVKARYYIGNNWAENTVTFVSAGNSFYSSSNIYSAAVAANYTGFVSLDIKDALVEWKNGTQLLNKGLCLLGPTTSGGHLNFSSSECSTNKPYLTVVFTPTLSETNLQLKLGETVQLTYKLGGSIPCASSWQSSDTNVATVSNNGLVTAVDYGTAIITVTDISGISSTATCNCIANENHIYILKNVGLSKFCAVYNANLSVNNNIIAESQTTKPEQLWQLKYVNGYYKIIPLHTNDLCIGVVSGSDAVVTQSISSSGDNVLWSIEPVGNGKYNIILKDGIQNSPKYLTTQTNNSNIKAISANGNYSKWEITEYINDTYWGGGYTNRDNLINVYFKVDMTNWDETLFPMSYFENVADAWNNISPNVHLIFDSPYSNDDDLPNGEQYIVTFYNQDFTNNPLYEYSETLGLTVAYINGIETNLSFANWEYCNIFINIDRVSELTAINSNNSSLRQALLYHEMGHALKLYHYNQDPNPNHTYKQYFPANMQPKSDFENLSNGYTWLEAYQQIGCIELTLFDKTALEQKWS